MVTEAGNIDEPRMGAIEREQVAMIARLDVLTPRMDRLFYANMGGSIGVIGALVAHAFKIS